MFRPEDLEALAKKRDIEKKSMEKKKSIPKNQLLKDAVANKNCEMSVSSPCPSEASIAKKMMPPPPKKKKKNQSQSQKKKKQSLVVPCLFSACSA